MDEIGPGGSDRLTLSVPEAALRLGISRTLAYELVSRGGLPSVRLGRRIVIPIAALSQMISDSTHVPTAEQVRHAMH
jgi:excisionase family DNA binding protein